MNFAELVAEVLVIVKRPDLQTRIEQSVRAATLKMHQSDFFYKDLYETAVQFERADVIQNFLPTEIYPNFRKVKYIRYWAGGIDGAPLQFLTPIQIENALDAYKQIKDNVYYMAGQLLQVRTCPAVERVLFGAYLHPIITPAESYKSWIADEYPYAIIYEAARAIFRSIGFQEQAGEYATLMSEVLTEIKLSSVDDVPLT